MRKRNPVVRDLIQRPPRGAGKHRDRRKRPDRRDEDLGFVPRNIFDKTPTRGFFYETICSPHHFDAATQRRNSEMKSQPPASIVALINSLPARLRATAMQHAKWDAETYYNEQLDVEVPVWDVELYDKRAWAAAEDDLRFRFFGH